MNTQYNKNGNEQKPKHYNNRKNKKDKNVSFEDVVEMAVNRLQIIYDKESGRKFILHLYMSFFPADKVEIQSYNNIDGVKCCVTDTNLSAENGDRYASMLVNVIKSKLSESLDKGVIHQINLSKIEKIGLFSKDSDKCISALAYFAMYKFLFLQIYNNNNDFINLIPRFKGIQVNNKH